MATRYISRKTSRLYENTTGGSYEMVLIFGDRVNVTTNVAPVNHRLRATYRGRSGFVREDHLTTEAPLEIYFIDVGQGDAAFIVTPGRKTILIDGGYNRQALGFLIWMYRLDQPDNSVDVDLLVLSHADADHIKGLIPIIEHDRINVQHVIHSGIATFQSGAFGTTLGDLDPSGELLTTWHGTLAELAGLPLSANFAEWRQVLQSEGVDYRGVDTEADVQWINDLFTNVSIEILGPRFDYGSQGFAWFDDTGHTINGHSVVLLLTCGGVQALFPGDLNVEGAQHLLADAVLANSMGAHILKCPHHGSHQFCPEFLDAVRPQVSVISSGDAPDHGHPRAVFLGAAGRASRSAKPLIFSTEIAATFVDSGETIDPAEVGMTLNDVDFSTSGSNTMARRLFKQRLPGIVNVRTDGERLFAARRVAAGYWWEAYGPLSPAP